MYQANWGRICWYQSAWEMSDICKSDRCVTGLVQQAIAVWAWTQNTIQVQDVTPDVIATNIGWRREIDNVN